MLSDQQLSDELGRALQDRTSDLAPRPDLIERVVRQARTGRRRVRIAAATATVAALVVGGVAFAGAQSSGLGQPGHLRLDSYTFRLPHGAHAASAHDMTETSAACAAVSVDGVSYAPEPNGSFSPNDGASTANQPAIADAVTANGGCVSALLTNPYTPGTADTPGAGFAIPSDPHSVMISGYSGTVETAYVQGAGVTPGSEMTMDGVSVPSGTQFVSLTLHIPAGGGQVQTLQVAAAGISEQQLASIVSSGLSSPASTTATG